MQAAGHVRRRNTQGEGLVHSVRQAVLVEGRGQTRLDVQHVDEGAGLVVQLQLVG